MLKYILKFKNGKNLEKIDNVNEFLENIKIDEDENEPLIVYLYKDDQDKYIIKTKTAIQCYGEKVFPNETLIGLNIPKNKEYQNDDHKLILDFINELKYDLEKKNINVKLPFDKESENHKTMNCKFVKNYDYGEGTYFYWKIFDSEFNKEPLLLEYNEWSQIIKQ